MLKFALWHQETVLTASLWHRKLTGDPYARVPLAARHGTVLGIGARRILYIVPDIPYIYQLHVIGLNLVPWRSEKQSIKSLLTSEINKGSSKP